MNEYGEGAVFNMAIETLKRMDFLLQECNLAASHKYWEIWRDKLRILSREVLSIGTNNKSKDNKEEEEIKTLENETNIFLNLYLKVPTKHRGMSYDISNLSKALRNWDFEIRKIMWRRNLLMAGRKDVRDAIGEF